MFNIIVLTVIGNVLGIEQGVLTTMMYILIGFVSILAVQEVCTPFTKIHTFLFVTTAVGFYVAALLFNKLLELTAVPQKEIIITAVLAVISYILIHVKRKVYKKKQIA